MIRSIVGSSLRHRLAVVAIATAIMVVGITGLVHEMPVDVLPEFAPPYVEIQTGALGLSVTEVDLLNDVPRLECIRSESTLGLSSAELIFEPGTDFMRAKQMVQERLTQAQARCRTRGGLEPCCVLSLDRV